MKEQSPFEEIKHVSITSWYSLSIKKFIVSILKHFNNEIKFLNILDNCSCIKFK